MPGANEVPWAAGATSDFLVPMSRLWSPTATKAAHEPAESSHMRFAASVVAWWTLSRSGPHWRAFAGSPSRILREAFRHNVDRCDAQPHRIERPITLP